MGESVCLMPAFSYTSGMSNETNQGNPVHALGESVSFGRFMTESLAWEKWSTFSQKRHVEEAERYAQPGSVAQKKAFFEAHYKRIAAKKAAALLEQENSVNNSSEPGLESSDCNNPYQDPETMEQEDSQVVAEEQQELIVHVNAKPVELEIDKLGGSDFITEPEVLVEIPTNIESFGQLENVEEQTTDSGLESTGIPQIERPLLKNCNCNQDVSRSVRKKRPVLSSLRSSVFRKVPSSPAKSIAPPYPRKENSFTPRTMKSTIDFTDKKSSTQKSLHKLINSTPAGEPDKLSTPAIAKNGSSRIAPPTCNKASKDFATPLRTPITASVNGVPRHPSRTPCSENSKRANTPLDPSASGSKTTGPKWHLISSVCSKSLTACRKKLESSTLSTPFILRTELRAAERKQKLEERFNEKEAHKVQMQTEIKEKTETEVKKFRQSLCFRARPLPEFYREREASKNQTKKTSEMHPQSPKLGGKPGPSRIQDTNPLTKSLAKNHVSKNVLKKHSQTPARYHASLPARTSH